MKKLACLFFLSMFFVAHCFSAKKSVDQNPVEIGFDEQKNGEELEAKVFDLEAKVFDEAFGKFFCGYSRLKQDFIVQHGFGKKTKEAIIALILSFVKTDVKTDPTIFPSVLMEKIGERVVPTFLREIVQLRLARCKQGSFLQAEKELAENIGRELQVFMKRYLKLYIRVKSLTCNEAYTFVIKFIAEFFEIAYKEQFATVEKVVVQQDLKEIVP